MDFPIPSGWNKGELLDVKRRGETFEVRPISARIPEPEEPLPPIFFYQPDECQSFVSWWYMR